MFTLVWAIRLLIDGVSAAPGSSYSALSDTTRASHPTGSRDRSVPATFDSSARFRGHGLPTPRTLNAKNTSKYMTAASARLRQWIQPFPLRIQQKPAGVIATSV